MRNNIWGRPINCWFKMLPKEEGNTAEGKVRVDRRLDSGCEFSGFRSMVYQRQATKNAAKLAPWKRRYTTYIGINYEIIADFSFNSKKTRLELLKKTEAAYLKSLKQTSFNGFSDPQ